jgi:hypothetical protein
LIDEFVFAGPTPSERRQNELVLGGNVARLMGALPDLTAIDFEETYLVDVLDYLEVKHDVDFHLDERAMRAANVTSDPPLTAKLEDVPLAIAIFAVLAPYDLTFHVRNEQLWVTSPEGAAGGADRTGVGSLGPAAQSPWDDALPEETALDFIETPLVDVLDYLGTKHDLAFVIDETGNHSSMPFGERPVTISLSGISLQAALATLLHEVGGACYLSDGTLVVCPEDTLVVQPSRLQP